MSEFSQVTGGFEPPTKAPNMRQFQDNKAAPRRCVNTVDPRGLADYQGVDCG